MRTPLPRPNAGTTPVYQPMPDPAHAISSRTCHKESYRVRIFRKTALATATAGLVIAVLTGARSFAADNGVPPAFDSRLGPPFATRPRPSLGNSSAPIIVVEIGSFKCAHCLAFLTNVFPKLKERYIDTGTVEWYMLMIPEGTDDIGNPVQPVARCALEQGCYWQIQDFLFQNSRKPVAEFKDLVARNPSINQDVLNRCLLSFAAVHDVSVDLAEAMRFKFDGTPVFIVRTHRADGQLIEAQVDGYQDVAYFGRLFARMLDSN
jgi:protein-disulfide isomerase